MNKLNKFKIETVILVLQKEIKELELRVEQHLKYDRVNIAILYQEDISAINEIIENLNETISN